MKRNPFRNFNELAVSPGRELALEIAAAGLVALNPESLLRNVVRIREGVLEIAGHSFSIASGRIFVIGGGKATDVMAAALEKTIGSRLITAGIVICKTQSARPEVIQVCEAGHPIPDQRGVSAMSDLMALKSDYNIGPDDLVICLLSGGASALMPCPAPGITLEDKQNLIRKLLASGADIAEVNAFRTRLSSSKGGGLGRHFSPATVVSLIVSDVIGNDLAAIGSGPTFAEDLSNCFNHIIGDSSTALEAMKKEAVQKAKHVLILSNTLQGEPEPVAREIAENILAGKFSDYDVLLAAGETTPVLPPNAGQGGRNQHFAASTLLALEKLPGGWTHVSLGSDGSDYLPDVAGAMVDSHTLQQIHNMGLSIREHLDRFDTYDLFKKTGNDLIETGPTGTNVGDLMIYVLR